MTERVSTESLRREKTGMLSKHCHCFLRNNHKKSRKYLRSLLILKSNTAMVISKYTFADNSIHSIHETNFNKGLSSYLHRLWIFTHINLIANLDIIN